MQPTKAPWAAGPSAVSRSSNPGSHVGQPPIKASPQLPTPNSTNSFFIPLKKIHSQSDLKVFLQCEGLREFVSFLLHLNESVKEKTLTEPCEQSEYVIKTLEILNQLSQFVDEIPPATHKLRYGNPAYRDWYDRMAAAAPELINQLLPESLQSAQKEIIPYFIDSFGNRTRIDYGTGHETTFAVFLFLLMKLGIYLSSDSRALVTKVFSRYLDLMRKIQSTYFLEPAGSHGVWGLDDYQILSFLWGSAQLVNHDLIRPKSIHNQDIIEQYHEDYMYLGCVRFVKQVKKGPLFETSPILNDISAVPNWDKANSGLIKMYQVEVLSKVPIMQHFLFGSLLPFPDDGQQENQLEINQNQQKQNQNQGGFVFTGN